MGSLGSCFPSLLLFQAEAEITNGHFLGDCLSNYSVWVSGALENVVPFDECNVNCSLVLPVNSLGVISKLIVVPGLNLLEKF